LGAEAVSSTPPPSVRVGEKGWVLLHATFSPSAPLVGEVTRTIYPFDKRQVLYVDKRDAVFLLGEDFELVEE
jgi:hypothetical protein